MTQVLDSEDGSKLQASADRELIEALEAKVNSLNKQAEEFGTEKSALQLEVGNLIEENERLHQDKLSAQGLHQSVSEKNL